MNSKLNLVLALVISAFSVLGVWLIPDWLKVILTLDVNLPVLALFAISSYKYWCISLFIPMTAQLLILKKSKSKSKSLHNSRLTFALIALLLLTTLTFSLLLYSVYSPISNATG